MRIRKLHSNVRQRNETAERTRKTSNTKQDTTPRNLKCTLVVVNQLKIRNRQKKTKNKQTIDLKIEIKWEKCSFYVKIETKKDDVQLPKFNPDRTISELDTNDGIQMLAKPNCDGWFCLS